MAVNRDDSVGQYIGYTAPQTKDVLKKAMGDVLCIDEAHYLYRPEKNATAGRRPSKSCCKSWRTSAMRQIERLHLAIATTTSPVTALPWTAISRVPGLSLIT